MNTDNQLLSSANQAESVNPDSSASNDWPSRYSESPNGLLVAHAHLYDRHDGSPAAEGRDQDNASDDIVGYFVTNERKKPIWPWNPKEAGLVTTKRPSVVGITHAALMEHFDEGYSIIMDAAAAEAVKERHASEEDYSEYEVIITPTPVEGAFEVSFEYKDWLEYEGEQEQSAK